MKNFNWKMVLLMVLILQFGMPILMAGEAFLIDNENYFKNLIDCFKISFFVLLFIFYLPLSFTILKKYF